MGNPHWGTDTLERPCLWVSYAGAVTDQRNSGCGQLTLQRGRQRGPVAVGDPCQGRNNLKNCSPCCTLCQGQSQCMAACR